MLTAQELRDRFDGHETIIMALVTLTQTFAKMLYKLDPEAVEKELREARILVQDINLGRFDAQEEIVHRKVLAMLERGLGREGPPDGGSQP